MSTSAISKLVSLKVKSSNTLDGANASNAFCCLTIFLLGLIFSPTAMGDNFEYVCPESIDVTESALKVDADWEVLIDKGRRGYFLDNIKFYYGHPRELANLVPDRIVRSKVEQKSIWHFAKGNHGEHWLACSYQNTMLIVSKKLPEGISQCQVVEQLLPSGVVFKIKRVACE